MKQVSFCAFGDGDSRITSVWLRREKCGKRRCRNLSDAAAAVSAYGEIHLVDDGDEEKEISDGTYSWKELEEGVVQEKYRALCDFFEGIDETRGMSFLYRMMELVRGHEEKINFARMMYLLSRLEPTEEGPKKEKYRQLSQKMYRWIQSDQDCRQLKTAINLYAYIHRTKGEHRDEN